MKFTPLSELGIPFGFIYIYPTLENSLSLSSNVWHIAIFIYLVFGNEVCYLRVPLDTYLPNEAIKHSLR